MIFDFSILKNNKAEDVLNIISEQDVYSFYLEEEIKPQKLHKCCFHEDDTPSLGFYKSTKYLNYKCFGCGASGNIFEFVKNKFNISYNESIERIRRDLIGSPTTSISRTSEMGRQIPGNRSFYDFKTEIYPTFKNFTKVDYDYWNQYYISLELLSKYKVNACSVVYYRNSIKYDMYAKYSNSNPIYHYNIDGSSKIYRPLNSNKTGKWFQNCSSWDIQGLEQIPYNNDIVFITSSLKDCMVLNVLGYAAIAPHGEGVRLPHKILDYVFATNKWVILFYDNDEAGIKYSKAHSEEYGIPYITIPNEYKGKDISDFVKFYNLNQGKILIDSLI